MNKKPWLVSIDMGYGHQRTAYALKKMARGEEIVSANHYKGMPQKDKNLWKKSRSFYEAISRFKNVVCIGDLCFRIYDKCQKILNFYPKRDLSESDFIQKSIYNLLGREWGLHLIKKLGKSNTSLITTFFNVAFMAEYFGYKNDIYCVVCDTDISRSWAPLDPQESKIKYFASTVRSAERLDLYGIKKKNIFLTGFPLPEEIIGKNDKIIKQDLKNRLLNLDPNKKYISKFNPLIKENLGKLPKNSDHPLTILFSVGGAGAQTEIGLLIVDALLEKLNKNEVKVILSVGIRKEVFQLFKKETKGIKNVEIIYDKDFGNYFDKFNLTLRKTDILWTKPSELSFYAQLAIPIIIAPEIGSQEKFNKRWIEKSHFGVAQKDPKYINDWLFDWIGRGYLAEMAMSGFIKGERKGVENISKVINKCSG